MEGYKHSTLLEAVRQATKILNENEHLYGGALTWDFYNIENDTKEVSNNDDFVSGYYYVCFDGSIGYIRNADDKTDIQWLYKPVGRL